MKIKSLFCFTILMAAGCATTSVITDDYGYSEKYPVKVAGASEGNGPRKSREYLSNLTGPNGENVTFSRIGSCCQFETKNGIFGMGMLDKYVVRVDGDTIDKVVYINMYDASKVHAPKGLLLKNKKNPLYR